MTNTIDLSQFLHKRVVIQSPSLITRGHVMKAQNQAAELYVIGQHTYTKEGISATTSRLTSVRECSSLSDEGEERLVNAIKPDVIDYIYNDERWAEFMMEVICDAIREKLDITDDIIVSNLAVQVMDKMTLR